MDAFVIALVAVLVLGIAVIAYGAFSDRAKHRREVARLTSAPARSIPQFSGQNVTPDYLSELQARRPPDDPSPSGIDQQTRTRLRAALDDAETPVVPVGYASKDFISDVESGWAVVERPVVLACAEPLTSIREIIALLERAILSDRPIALVAPAITAELLKTLEVNQIQRKIRIVVVLSKDPKPVDTICAVTGARLVDRADLQAGYVGDDQLGQVDLWLSTAKRTYLVTGAED